MREKSYTSSIGAWGERLASKSYQKLGYQILQRNYFNRQGKRLGEIDFVAVKNKQIIFVEVKTRSIDSVSKFGSAVDSVTAFKQQRLLRAVAWFLLAFPKFQDFQPQIDVCLVEYSKVDNAQNNVIIISNAVESRNG